MRKRIVSFFVTALMAVTTLSPTVVMADCTDTSHSWGEWKSVETKTYENTDGETGSVEKFERKCTSCGETEEGSITKTKKPATCTEDGYETTLDTMNPEEDVS